MWPRHPGSSSMTPISLAHHAIVCVLRSLWPGSSLRELCCGLALVNIDPGRPREIERQNVGQEDVTPAARQLPQHSSRIEFLGAMGSPEKSGWSRGLARRSYQGLTYPIVAAIRPSMSVEKYPRILI
jgi:hypothetical protein